MACFEHGYALLIGVGTTHDPKLSLPATVADMLALRAILTDADFCGYPDNADHLRLLHDADATRENILDGLTWLQTQAERDQDATVIVYYSGHGGLLTDTHEYVLLPYETDRSNLAGSTLSAQAFTAALRAIPAKRLLTILDCCHAEGMATAKDADVSDDFLSVGVSKGIIADLKQGEGRAVFTSSKGQ
ncbi:caspase domain protein, putative [Candidatus Moduliflexus flocculans]|uniref:Caspase domain protein, putative n=1 Tax=Candidatus Moduliflexus flocculans TaxID=1499966 RepID=A0A081BMH8_9BACT|nr:caspase domain protein, putative [Candidatus Moduliflexus flocculans]